MPGTPFELEVRSRLPEALTRLNELAGNLLYSWNHDVRHLFSRLDPDLWRLCGHNPRIFLRRISQEKLDHASTDRNYLADLNRVLGVYDAYRVLAPRPEVLDQIDPGSDLVAYFSAEFGFHESFPIYSGGLGILAADHCKAASDLGLPFVAVGLLYQEGFFIQSIDGEGSQQVRWHRHSGDDLPVSPALTDAGEHLIVEVPLPGRVIRVGVWEAMAGNNPLYLLDTCVDGNSEEDRRITLQLYGGDEETRIQQELVLGIGGVRALLALGLAPTVWHINEGHAAFLILERCAEFVESGLSFEAALEVVASSTLFTTHTPVPAGHDIFHIELFRKYLFGLGDRLGISFEALFQLGTIPGGQTFNMTLLGLRGSRYHNGVSRLHGTVAAAMEADLWPQVPPEDNPITYITNGVHVPTFLAREWSNLFDMQAPNWREELRNVRFWDFLDRVPDYHYWSVHKTLKQQMLDYVRRHVERQHRRNGTSVATTRRTTAALCKPDRDLLVIGFARRFATYKRATLLFSDPARLERLIGDPDRPVLVIFAGKAHPRDKPGQQLIKVIHELSQSPQFIGRVLLLEGYDQAMARQLLAGVDVWLNTPEYPMEACGTSGQKAAINGALNLSVLDGWWGEGYEGDNGWAITPRDTELDMAYRNLEEAKDLLDILEYEVLPLYFDHDGRDYPKKWVTASKAAMKSILPRFNAERMVMDYLTRFYRPAVGQRAKMTANGYEAAQNLSQWKQKVREAWPEVTIRVAGKMPGHCHGDEPVTFSVAVEHPGLDADDLRVECVVESESRHPGREPDRTILQLSYEDGLFRAGFEPPFTGQQVLRVRAYPWHPMLSHPFEMGCMVWV